MNDKENFASTIARNAYNYEFNKISLEDYQKLKDSGLEDVRLHMVNANIFSETITDRISELIRIIEVLSVTGYLKSTSIPQFSLADSVKDKILTTNTQPDLARAV